MTIPGFDICRNHLFHHITFETLFLNKIKHYNSGINVFLQLIRNFTLFESLVYYFFRDSITKVSHYVFVTLLAITVLECQKQTPFYYVLLSFYHKINRHCQTCNWKSWNKSIALRKERQSCLSDERNVIF